jgi:hypothetical protein
MNSTCLKWHMIPLQTLVKFGATSISLVMCRSLIQRPVNLSILDPNTDTLLLLKVCWGLEDSKKCS